MGGFELHTASGYQGLEFVRQVDALASADHFSWEQDGYILAFFVDPYGLKRIAGLGTEHEGVIDRVKTYSAMGARCG